MPLPVIGAALGVVLRGAMAAGRSAGFRRGAFVALRVGDDRSRYDEAMGEVAREAKRIERRMSGLTREPVRFAAQVDLSQYHGRYASKVGGIVLAFNGGLEAGAKVVESHIQKNYRPHRRTGKYGRSVTTERITGGFMESLHALSVGPTVEYGPPLEWGRKAVTPKSGGALVFADGSLHFYSGPTKPTLIVTKARRTAGPVIGKMVRAAVKGGAR